MRGQNPGINEDREINHRLLGWAAPREDFCRFGASDFSKSRGGEKQSGSYSCATNIISLPWPAFPGGWGHHSGRARKSQNSKDWEAKFWPCDVLCDPGVLLNLSEL
jgi:hypothetical protein